LDRRIDRLKVVESLPAHQDGLAALPAHDFGTKEKDGEGKGDIQRR